MKISGIYKIINKIDGKYYVGSSNNIHYRWKKHRQKLKRNKHHNILLQRSWDKYTQNDFEFVIVENIPESNLLTIEQLYLDIAKNEKEKCYNLVFIAGGGNLGEEVNKKISDSLKKRYSVKNHYWCGKSHNKNTIQKMINNHVGFLGKHHSENSKNKIRINSPKINLGKHLSEKTKEKIRLSRLGKLLSESHKQKIKENSCRGDKNAMYKKDKFLFLNTITNEKFCGNRNEFYTKYNLHKGNVSQLVLGKINSVKNWRLVTS